MSSLETVKHKRLSTCVFSLMAGRVSTEDGTLRRLSECVQKETLQSYTFQIFTALCFIVGRVQRQYNAH